MKVGRTGIQKLKSSLHLRRGMVGIPVFQTEEKVKQPDRSSGKKGKGGCTFLWGKPTFSNAALGRENNLPCSEGDT